MAIGQAAFSSLVCCSRPALQHHPGKGNRRELTGPEGGGRGLAGLALPHSVAVGGVDE